MKKFVPDPDWPRVPMKRPILTLNAHEKKFTWSTEMHLLEFTREMGCVILFDIYPLISI